MAYGIIYKTINLLNGKTYIGQSTQKKETLNKYFGSGYIILEAIKKYGKENFEKEILCECDNQDQLDRLERLYISLLVPDYNIGLGGYGRGSFSDDTKKKMSEQRKGKSHTQEWNNNIGKANNGRKTWIEGKHHSEETKQKLNLKNKGRKMSEEAINKNRSVHLGIKASDETKKKMSDKKIGSGNSMFGKKQSDETKKKISEAQKRRFQKIKEQK